MLKGHAIGFVNFSWGHAKVKSLTVDDRYVRERFIPQSKSTIIKNKYVLRYLYLAGQEKMCRMSGMAQQITPQLLNLRSRDQDTHRVLKVASQPWPTLVGMKLLIDYTIEYNVDRFCRYKHENIAERRAIRQSAVDRASGTSDGQVLPVHECEAFVHKRPSPRILVQINPDLVAGSSSSLSRSSLSLPRRLRHLQTLSSPF